MNVHDITVEQLGQLGMHRIAYLRPVSVDGEACFEIHAADGTPLALVDGLEEALQAVVQNEMIPLALH